MAYKEKGTKRRLRSSYITSVISISLVLFMLGLMGLLILNAQQLSNYVKENIGVSIILKKNVKEVEIRRLQKTLDATNYVKATQFVDEETAAKELQKELGEDFVSFLGYNPLMASIDVKLYAAYANPDSIAKIEKDFTKYNPVQEVYYQKSLVHLVNDNVKRIGLILLAFSALLLIISFTLINNTIRLSIYSQRFIINTMQLVGATRSFILKPFMGKSLVHGILGALIANAMLSGVIYISQKELSQVITFDNVEILGILFILILLLGIFITWISTLFAVNKYLRLESRSLY
ncbi:cell division protein FtsX [Ancylomarina longa]|uniref:Cell division protein FtsX n=1 Tax=Ancylomarina longa TaxID=2487017 RepID=A0A434AW68_9BACT|nr:permease-like cell division protein FtsX [Ancylomarina longa]RUT78749.1 FtsX-like permease family protein [Ancylomarina longa]